MTRFWTRDCQLGDESGEEEWSQGVSLAADECTGRESNETVKKNGEIKRIARAEVAKLRVHFRADESKSGASLYTISRELLDVSRELAISTGGSLIHWSAR